MAFSKPFRLPSAAAGSRLNCTDFGIFGILNYFIYSVDNGGNNLADRSLNHGWTQSVNPNQMPI
jgi:hypothetical protein